MSTADATLRTPEELRTLFELRPHLRDVIVEGRSDALLVQHFLRHAGASDHLRVLAVDDRARIDSETVRRFGASVGARGRVVALAEHASTWALPEPSLTCIVDLDWNSIERPEARDGLLYTDFGSMDVYALQSGVVQKFLELVVGDITDADTIIREIIPPLRDLFAVRYVLHRHGPDIPVVHNFTSCCGTVGGTLSVDIEELLRRSLNRVERFTEFERLLPIVLEIRQSLPAEPLQSVRGHDIAPLLIYRLNLRNQWAIPETVEAALRGCLEMGELLRFPMFAALHDRVSE